MPPNTDELSKEVIARELIERVVAILTCSWEPVKSLKTVVVRRDETFVQYPYQPSASHTSLAQYVHDTLRWSQTDFVTLRTATNYLETVATLLPAMVAEAAQTVTRVQSDPTRDKDGWNSGSSGRILC
ncbi:hypothetical protein AURDEDRAFT_172943 [Auricularia subglabra TFB-10046 SS5]|uniref:Uncharacterized protein n=1 Tax=Auricularia subglabra (strain TFB-10046 / SS5) TaxID=717982 RepID=J0D0S4_AURST|nr:hypothetical protein AURDEDRAFT_172943 [Auricularia subglabra TFB-10046 SS5]